ncbi:hypothetical protein ENSA5_69150 [Enhygromyxa salina]|uniref:Uncharacterized protein n=1 Tax=Enhygromyxa salina TaxID=215803 RepID=A0A2S9XAT8_9BACT|nr:hypothetical protein [Enhygromyxa salina]PRP89974.1 hypothetical protein ENSA5_69150 [Enhygromyxa salina]
MPCKDEAEKNDDAWSAVLEAEAALAKAHHKLENRLKIAMATCGTGALTSILGLGPLIAGGMACIGALLAADDADADYEYAIAMSELAGDKHARTLVDELLCLSRCGPVELPPNS